MTEEGRDEREKEEGEREGDAVSQLQFLDQPVVTMGLSRSVSKKNVNFSQKIALFYIPGSSTPPLRPFRIL